MLLAVNVVVAMLAGAPPAPIAPPQFGFSVAAMGDNMVLQQAPAAVSDRLIRFLYHIYLLDVFFKVASVRALLAPCFLRHLIRGTGCRKLACADVPNSVALAVFSSFSFVSLSSLLLYRLLSTAIWVQVARRFPSP